MNTECEDPAALVVLANFESPLAVGAREVSIQRQWSQQAPRKLWLTRPGDVVITPVPISEPFRRYVAERLGTPRNSVRVVTLPDTPGLPMSQALKGQGLLRPLRAMVRDAPGARLLPTALDAASIALAADLDIPVLPYEAGRPRPDVLRAVAELNTKSGFRIRAGQLALRLPHGVVCTGAQLGRVIGELLSTYEEVVVKPDRSAGGHGLRFVTRNDRSRPAPPPHSRWVVERYVADARAVSAQGEVTAAGVEVPYDGEMRMSGGSFTGYRAPLDDLPEKTREELAGWTRALGRHLAATGYRGPYSLDAVADRSGTLYALECNVRRTATTTAHALVTRLTRAGHPAPAWSTGTVRTGSRLSFDRAVARLDKAGLDFRPGDVEGVLLYTDRPKDGRGWRYAALAPDRARLAELEARLTAALGSAQGGPKGRN
ncbi:peptide ligase PGM1-related protein [Streptomyces sp. NPDC048111]|uniref:preATP grasp domain-containing protein n=1 Tax=Streptomyces sp. NPDC048111 TaxID=3365500 RepID=UPI0037151978